MFPTDTKFAFWLQWFTGDYPWATRWFLLTDGRKCATDGRTAVATSASTDQTTDEFPDKKKHILEMLGKMFNAPAKEAVWVPHQEAVAMFGEAQHPKEVECPACKGKKRVRHNCMCELCEEEWEECKTCGASGVVEEGGEDRHCSVFGKPFDPDRIAYILAHAPVCESVKIELVPFAGAGSGTLLRITGDGWQSVTCDMAPNVLKVYPCPEVIKVTHEVV